MSLLLSLTLEGFLLTVFLSEGLLVMQKIHSLQRVKAMQAAAELKGTDTGAVPQEQAVVATQGVQLPSALERVPLNWSSFLRRRSDM